MTKSLFISQERKEKKFESHFEFDENFALKPSSWQSVCLERFLPHISLIHTFFFKAFDASFVHVHLQMHPIYAGS